MRGARRTWSVRRSAARARQRRRWAFFSSLLGVGDIPDALRALLKQVSRSFYLSLAILPASLRGPISLAYLLARAADTIADTRIIPRTDRLRYLDMLQAELDSPPASRLAEIAGALTGLSAVSAQAGPQRIPAERDLLARLPECFGLFRALLEDDRTRIRTLLLALTHGMQEDLRTFPGESHEDLVALESQADLERYTYHAAGCVGEFWTDMTMAHCPGLGHWDATVMRRRGMRFGQGLQMTNVLRDLAHDFRIGRCCLPRQDLTKLDLTPNDLLDPGAVPRLRPLLNELLRLTLEYYAEGFTYLLAIPRTEFRLRLACAWPLLIGLRTLDLVQRSRNLLDPHVTVKISRSAVYAIMVRSTLLAWSDGGLERYYRELRNRIGAPSMAAH